MTVHSLTLCPVMLLRAPFCDWRPPPFRKIPSVLLVQNIWRLLTLVTVVSTATIPEELQCVYLPIITQSECEAVYPDAITENMLCAGVRQGGADTCQVRKIL